MLSRVILWLFLLLLHSETLLAQPASRYNSVVSSLRPFSFSPIFSALKQGHLVFQAGGYWSAQGQAQHIAISGLIGDEFTVNQHTDSNGLVGLGYFTAEHDLSGVQLSYGVNFFYLPRASVSGTVIQEDLFSNLSYSYQATHYPVYASARAKTALPVNHLALTLDAGIGLISCAPVTLRSIL